MSEKVTLPRYDIPLDNQGNVRISRDWYRFMSDLVSRLGGPVGTSTPELEAAAFEDAGIEETKAQINVVRDEFSQADLWSLLSEVARLSKRVDDLESSPPTLPAVAADPTASVGLTASNGVASTFMRSDAAPPLDQTKAYTFTDKITFTKNPSGTFANGGNILLSNTRPAVFWDENDQAAHERGWGVDVNLKQFRVRTYSDDSVTVHNILTATRGAGANLTTVDYGEASALTAHQFAGKLRPATDAGASQTACTLYAGTGVPSNANGANGDYYFRSDGGVGTHIYFKSGGAWAGIV
jgi:hypothetical protein